MNVSSINVTVYTFSVKRSDHCNGPFSSEGLNPIECAII